jgi:hypothetical protein
MAFDLSTAKPASGGGFDLSTAQPTAEPEQESLGVGGAILGAANLANIGITQLGEQAVRGASALGGPLLGKSVGESLASAENLTESIPDVKLTKQGQQILQSVSEAFSDSPEIVQDVVNAFSTLPEAVRSKVFDITGSPAAAAIAGAIPEALELGGGFLAPGVLSKPVGQLGRRAEAKGAELVSDAEALRAPPTAEEGLKQVTEKIKTGSPDQIAAITRPDTEFFKAVDELNINVEPLASFGSKNPQFRAVEQGLASIPASQLDSQGKAFISELAKKADDLIEQYGGTKDKAELSDRFRAESISAAEKLSLQTDKLYDALADNIPPSSRVPATNTAAFIRKKAQELGGRKELPPTLNRVLRQLESKQGGRSPAISGVTSVGKQRTIDPTHERLNQTRREIGQAINKGSGPFKDQETGLLKALYSNLRKDQDVAAAGFGVSDISDSANALVRQRKHLEDNLAKLLGKDLEGSILPKVGQALKGLQKGEVKKWDSVMEKIPRSIRQEIVVSSLNNIFSGTGLQGKALNPTQFTKFMDDLDRSPATKNRLLKELPAESIRALENLRKVSKGVSIALQDKIPTGRVAAFFENNDGMLRRLMGKGVSFAATLKGGPLAGAAVNEFLNQSTSGAKAASAALASSKFQNMMRTAVRDGFTDGAEITKKLNLAEKQFQKSKAFDRWAKTLAEDERAKLLSVGAATYLLRDEDQ